jgi:hypothetical protein
MHNDLKTIILTRCLFKNCWSIGIGGGIGDIYSADFKPTYCEFINCSEGSHSSGSTVGGGFFFCYYIYDYIFYFLLL